MIRMPGLVDIHVHLREPGQNYKEDFFSGTKAALAGGFVFLLDMPNNKNPVTTLAVLQRKINLAEKKVVCDLGFYAGSLGNNLNQLRKMEPFVFGLKIYLNQTTGNYLVNREKFERVLDYWESKKPVLVHAEGELVEYAIRESIKRKKRLHICHVSSVEELKAIIKAKLKGFDVTCGVTPHHLFLDEKKAEQLGSFGLMKPPINSGFIEFVWRHLDYVDVVESDHAPHTKTEKLSSSPPFGVPGLETTLPLLLTAVSEGKLTLNQVIKLCYSNPKEIFAVPVDEDTYIEVDEQEEYQIKNENLFTKCRWSPFNGWRVRGKVKKVVIRGIKVFEDNKLLVKPGFGYVYSNRY